MMFKWTGIIVGGLLIALFAIWLIMVTAEPRVEIRCARDGNGNLIVDLKPNRQVNVLYSVRFWVEGDEEYLWIVSEHKVGIGHLLYGRVPPGATQNYPLSGSVPRPIPQSGVLCVGVRYQYDGGLPPAPSAGSLAARFQLGKDGEVVYVGPIKCRTDLVESEKPPLLDNAPVPQERVD